MISRPVGSSPASGSALSLWIPLGVLSPSLSLPLPCSLFLKINEKKKRFQIYRMVGNHRTWRSAYLPSRLASAGRFLMTVRYSATGHVPGRGGLLNKYRRSTCPVPGGHVREQAALAFAKGLTQSTSGCIEGAARGRSKISNRANASPAAFLGVQRTSRGKVSLRTFGPSVRDPFA